VAAIALGTGVVVWVTCCYESVQTTIFAWAEQYAGRSHISVESPVGKYGQIPQRLTRVLTAVPGVESMTERLILRLRAKVVSAAGATQPTPEDPSTWGELDFHGIDLEREFAFRDYKLATGRMLRPDDEYACVLEQAYAEEVGAGVGDFILVHGAAQPQPYALEIVGLLDWRRIMQYQKGLALVRLPVLQHVSVKETLVTAIDLRLHDPSTRNLHQVAGHVRRLVWPIVRNASITSAESKLEQISRAQNQMQFVLLLLSSVAMLTALFIILSTLSMGMVERIAQLGLMRCVGLTGLQLAALVLLELLPLGVVGIVLGVPVGLGLTGLTVLAVPERVPFFAVSWTGIQLAAVAGLATTLIAAVLPAAAAAGVSPLEAARPQARRPRRIWLALACVAAVLVLGCQILTVQRIGGLPDCLQQVANVIRVERTPWFTYTSAAAVTLLYLTYALVAPLLVWAVGSSIVVLVAWALRVRRRLLQDQVGDAVWRSAGICCGLMVGLSLIVGLVVFSESVAGGWEFPKEFPEAYFWSHDQCLLSPEEVAARAGDVPGVRNLTVANAVNVIVQERPVVMEQVFKSVTWFLGVEPDTFFDLVHLHFLEGNLEDAQRLLRQGGHVVIAKDFARTRNKKLGDKVRVYLGGWHEFTVAGVVDSPAIDIAATWFQHQSELHVAATGSVMGTNTDLERFFNVRGSRLILMNFELPPEPVPAGWPGTPAAPAEANLGSSFFDERIPLERRYQRYREQLVLREIRDALGVANAESGTVRELKDQIDDELTTMTRLLTAVPAVALLVAALGVANLMTANVAARARQLAILRAVGATRGLILRLVVGEALVLGVIGSGLGLALGMHLALDTTIMTERMWGFDVPFAMPWGYVIIAAALTIGLCIAAAIGPARHASRTDVISALHVA